MANRGVSRLAPAVGAALAAGLLVAPPGQADLADITMRTAFDIRIDGTVPDSAREVTRVGDVNGDGVDDLLVGEAPIEYYGRAQSGTLNVVFGGVTGPVDLGALGDRGFRITTASPEDGWGTSSVDGAGDIDGDGYDDLVIGVPSATQNSRFISGAAYVVRGGAAPGDVDLADLGSRGFRIDGAATGDGLGWSVAGAGDVNRDGYDDIVLGARNAENNDRERSGSAYVVFGGSTDPLDLAALGNRGFRIDGAAPNDWLGDSVAGAVDVDADGIDDLLLGAIAADHNGVDGSGSVYVVWGGTTADVDLADLGDRGFRIDGAQRYGQLGVSVAGAGDVNADGVDDLLLGAWGEDHGAGSVYVVFGGDGRPLDLRTLGSRGFRIDGIAQVGDELAGTGDVDADGYDDLLLGTFGGAYLVFGGTARTVALSHPGNRALRIKGARKPVAGPGDINRDGYADLLVGDRRHAYVLYGRPRATLNVKARTRTRKVNATARTRLVRRITVGSGQQARVTVKVLPKKAGKTVTVKATKKRVVVRTRNTPRKTRIRVRIASSAPDHFTKTWTRTWRVR
ncbi:MAG: FG-GAP repeat protein [Actinobacteria bacterium]|nr:FG-GAP repeat protein [Actinomycetota bacterium]MCB8996099.1 FG-GAP repeat protein [Actinomycetota bacterium]HRY08336.1 integrin alpha [Candidatus Nanopelagicales bacterium]